MDRLKEELQQLEKIEEKEESELKKFLQELAQQDEHRKAVQKVFQDVEELVEINREIVELTELLENEPENFLKIYRKLKSLIRKHDELEENLVQELEQLGVPERQLEILYRTDQRLENIDEELVEEIGSRRSEQAERILDNRPTIYFEAKPLEKFISATRREQVGKGVEVPGVFGFEKFRDGYRLKKFLELENTQPGYGGFNLKEQVTYVLENYGNRRDVIVAHSHPRTNFSHSSTDKDLISKANNVGVIGVPKGEKVYPVPQALENASWTNLPSRITEKGRTLSIEETRKRFPEVAEYNHALKKALSEGNEKRWPNLL